MINICDVGSTFGFGCSRIFEPWKVNVKNYSLYDTVKQLDDVDLILFGGGADIHPSLYGHKNVASHVGPNPSRRDVVEKEVFEYGLNKGKKFLGICRGAQLLCALHGGWLVQNVHGHGGKDHTVRLVDDPDGEESVVMNSYHHQMMMPNDAYRASVLGYTDIFSREMAFDVEKTGLHPNMYDDINPEIVRFGKSSLAFQCHPEWTEPNGSVATKVRKYVNYYLNLGEYR